VGKHIGVLTAGGDSPGLNAAIRGLGKSAIGVHDMTLIGFRDGVRGLAENRFVELSSGALSGILTVGGTILGTSRDKVQKMDVDGVLQGITALYTALQAGQVVATVPGVAPVADEIAKSAGFKDMLGADPNIPQLNVPPATPATMAATPGAELMQTDGATQGIQTVSADGVTV